MDTSSYILIVEDDPQLNENLKEILVPSFGEVRLAYDGVEALRLVREQEPALILTDINMPRQDGVDFFRQLRASGYQTPTLFLTGFGSREHVVNALKLGAADFIDKPFDVDDLIRRVGTALEIEKRRLMLSIDSSADPAEKNRRKKMLGLLQAVNAQKRKSS